MVRSIVLCYAALIACLSIVQGVYILKTGCVKGVFARFGDKSRAMPKPALAMRVSCAILYFIVGVALIALLVVSAVKRHMPVSSLPEHVRAISHVPLWLLLSVGVGIWAMIHPSGALGWARSAYPEIAEDDPRFLLLIRVIGVGICVIALVMVYAFVGVKP